MQFVREYMISKASEHGTRFGFENDMLLSNYPISKDQGIATTPQVKHVTIMPQSSLKTRVLDANLSKVARIAPLDFELFSTKGHNNSILPMITDRSQTPKPLHLEDS